MISTDNNSIRTDPFIKSLLQRLPGNIDKEFTDQQLAGLKIAFAKQSWKDHPIEFRYSIGLLNWRYYFVFVAGRVIRGSKLRKGKSSIPVKTLFVAALIICILLIGLLLIYLVKSMLGIDFFPEFSLGIWSWLNSFF